MRDLQQQQQPRQDGQVRVLLLFDQDISSLSLFWSPRPANPPTRIIHATRIVMHDTIAHMRWIDAVLATVRSTESSAAGQLTVQVVGNGCPENWIRYIDAMDGVQAYRMPEDVASTIDVVADPASAVRLFRRLVTTINESDELDESNEPCTIEHVPLVDGSMMVDATAAEGLGIAALTDRLVAACVTASGKKLLRHWFAFPSLTEEARTARLDSIEALVSQRHVLGLTQNMLKRIGSTHARAVETMWKTQTLPKPDRAASFLKLAETLASLEDLNKVTDCLSDDSALAVAHAKFLVEAILDQAQFPDGMCVRYGVCPHLDELKTSHFRMDIVMTKILEHERGRIPKELLRGATELFTWHPVHVPSIGVFVHVPQGLMPPYLEDVLSDWALAFEPGCLQRDLPGGLYVSDACRALNERYGNIMLEIADREAAIVNQLTDKLLQMRDDLSSAFDAVAALDCLCALAQFAAEQDMCRPEFASCTDDDQAVTDGKLSIQGGWHPVLRSPSRNSGAGGMVAVTLNDTDLCQRSRGGRAVVVIGGTGTGKGVYLSQVGIICFLASMGSFVPAKRAVVPKIDRIFSLSAYGESIRDSSFSAGIRIVSEMLQWGTGKSLFLLESFGSATVSCDGVALAAVVIRDLAKRGGLLIFATHMRNCLIDTLGGLMDDDTVAFRTMHLATAEHNGTRVPLYSLREGSGEEGEADDLWNVGDASFSARVRKVSTAMRGGSSYLDRDTRFTMRRALEVVGRLRFDE